MMDKYLLQRVIIPEAKDKDYKELFIRSGVTEGSVLDKNFTTLSTLSFDTWMNLFAAKKWYHYCCLDDLFLKINFKGNYCLKIVGSNQNSAYKRIDETLFWGEIVDEEKPLFIKIDAPQNYDALYFLLYFDSKNPCEFISAGWYTNTMPREKNTLAVVTCTYKREKYILKTIRLFENYLKENEQLQERLHLFVIDNGQTLDLEQEYEYTNVLYNINAGGAGGFCRGLIEVCQSNADYTRCLFMDDDVEILPESFYRTLVLADYLKPEYSDAHINGAMLDLYDKAMFFENLGIQDGLWCHPYHKEANLFDYDEILRVNDMPDELFGQEYPKVHAGWYYSSFPINKKHSIDDLPLPIFIRGDDVEWGRRNCGKTFIQLNGICIWHASFYYRVSKITDNYFLSRNMFIVNVLHTPNFKTMFEGLYREKFDYIISTYDYVAAKLINKALVDVLKGTKIFYENPIDIMNELSHIAKENRIAAVDKYKLQSIKSKCYGCSKTKKIINKIVKITFKKMPYIKCLIKKDAVNETEEWCPPIEAFLFKKHVHVYNLYNHTWTKRDFNYKLEQQLRKEFNTVLNQIKENFDILSNDYNTNFHVITSYDFWKDYLMLN